MDCTPRARPRSAAYYAGVSGAACCAAAVALVFVPIASVHAQNNQPALRAAVRSDAANPAAPKTAMAVRSPNAIRVDGVLDEEIWRTAPAITEFWQVEPHEGEPGSEPTEVRIVYGDDAIYFGARAWDSQADKITAQLTRRDEDSPSDWIVIAIDSYHDHRTGYAFFVNPAGVKRDVYLFDDGNDDDSWNAVWDVGTSRDDEGWTAEFRIPWSQLRFSSAPSHDFGLQVLRSITRLNEEQHWRLMPKDQSGLVSQFGDLSGIEGIEPPRRVEVMPYVAGTGAFGPEEAGNPFQTGRSGTGRIGADLNMGITSNLTLSATINPDFGQVEADPAVVNLSAFETFYPEKRPFFNEGLDIFRFPILLGDGDGANEQLFY
ncbi:MAG: carbohydrate binding family 9 domain-containing protein, partial [Gemmatimonadales bacterium]|nr:carbohydrate binding family 9 domain-containing protein [Gemmatimonadales bacterium]